MASSSTNKVPLRILLIGKTGHGKSSTGNSILGRKEFRSSGKFTSTTTEVKDAYAEHGLYSIKIVDSPGLEGTGLNEAEKIETACQNMVQAMLLCNGGVHVFVLVLRLGERFTTEEKKATEHLKALFGENYLRERGIIVLTHGDQFEFLMEEEETPEKTFMEWCREQEGDIKSVFDECSFRIILFNNVSKSEEEKDRQRDELLSQAQTLSQRRGLYTNEHFQNAQELRNKLIKEGKLSMFKEGIQTKIDLLAAELGCLSEKSTVVDVNRLEIRIEDLGKEIAAEGVDDSVQEIKDQLESIQWAAQGLKTDIKRKSPFIKERVGELHRLKEKLKEARQKIPWKEIFIGLGIAAGVAAGGAAVVGGIAAICALGGAGLLARAALFAAIAIIKNAFSD